MKKWAFLRNFQINSASFIKILNKGQYLKQLRKSAAAVTVKGPYASFHRLVASKTRGEKKLDGFGEEGRVALSHKTLKSRGSQS